MLYISTHARKHAHTGLQYCCTTVFVLSHLTVPTHLTRQTAYPNTRTAPGCHAPHIRSPIRSRHIQELEAAMSKAKAHRAGVEKELDLLNTKLNAAVDN
jgi:hypothetical protein